MPNRRLGFGIQNVRLLIHFCKICVNKYGTESEQFQYALDDLREYREIHSEAGYLLPHDILSDIDELLSFKTCKDIQCQEISKESFFGDCVGFKEFALSRHTSRYYLEGVDNDLIYKAVDLAKTAPSACNTQSIRVVVASGKEKDEIVNIQSGNRGFGDTIDKMIIITAESKCWRYHERHEAYLDGGIFVMNLLYALHYYKICACTLNAHLKISQQRKMRKIAGLSDSEIVVSFISVGLPTDKMRIAKSRRLNTETILRFV